MLKIHVCKSSKTGKLYAKLVAHLGYAERVITFDSALCAELLGVSMCKLFEKEDVYELEY